MLQQLSVSCRSNFLFRAAAAFYAVPQQLSMPCRSSFLCRAVAISARGLSVFRAVGLNVLRVAGILILCSVQQLSVPCSSFLFRAAVFCSVQLFSVPCSCFLFRAVVFCAAAGLYLWATVSIMQNRHVLRRFCSSRQILHFLYNIIRIDMPDPFCEIICIDTTAAYSV